MDWTGLMIFLLVVGAIISYAIAPLLRRRRLAADNAHLFTPEPARSHSSAPPPPAAPAAPRASANELATLTPAEWLLSIALEKAVHLMLVGETGSGKSTVANALLYGRARTEQLVIIDPHATPTTWGGLPAVGVGRNYPAIEVAFVALEAEMTRRFTELAAGRPVGTPLSIFVDEYPTIAANCKQVAPAFKALAREARKVGMRMIILTQDANVKTLGIEGEGAVRENFSRILLGSFAVRECPALAGQEYAAVLDYKGKIGIIDTACCKRFEGQAIAPARLWDGMPALPPPRVPKDPAAFDINAELARFIGAEDAAVSGIDAAAGSFLSVATVNTGDTDQIPAKNTAENTGLKLTKGRREAIIKAAAKNVSRTIMAGLIGGSKDDALALIAEVLGPAGEENDLQEAA